MKNENWTVSITRDSGGMTERIDCSRAEFNIPEKHVGCVEYEPFGHSLDYGIWLVGVITLFLAGVVLLQMLRGRLTPFEVSPGAGLFMFASWPIAVVGLTVLAGLLS